MPAPALYAVESLQTYLKSRNIMHQIRDQYACIFPFIFHIEDKTLHTDCIYQIGINKNKEEEFLYADTLLAITIPDETLTSHALTLCNAVNLEAVTSGGYIVFNYDYDNRFMYRNGLILPDHRLDHDLLDKLFGYTHVMIDAFVRTLDGALEGWGLKMRRRTDTFYEVVG
ncbi:Uncharacterized protein dnl_06930 [Desulfonema limicola]|uniref:YbjN domain-containing protein n=1 Tax=Desulfonema limicola TaxID=45656 RepID=A0A975B474_9BACT|nr:hypothetical protein [Desulfonema limicola]QTA78471.1 Uncharacterized protein dnl_06930 [Desulfonema limicola]